MPDPTDESAMLICGTIGVVFAVLLWLLVFGRIVVSLGVIEVRRAERYPSTTAPLP